MTSIPIYYDIFGFRTEAHLDTLTTSRNWKVMLENFFVRSVIRKVVIVTYKISYDTKYNNISVCNPGGLYL